MSFHCAAISFRSHSLEPSICSINEATNKRRTLQKRINLAAPSKLCTDFLSHDSPEPTNKPCFCGRRHFIEASTLGTALFPIQPSVATGPCSDYTVFGLSPPTQIIEKRKAYKLGSNSSKNIMFLLT